MILAIDIGNSNIVLGCLNEKQIFFVSRISTDNKKASDQYAVEIGSILSLYNVNISDIKGAIISSVVPPLSNAISAAVELLIGIVPLQVGPEIKTGLNILIDNPEQTGSDLVVAAVAAIFEYKKPIILIDMGTATTITVIDGNANFLGGAIIPGLQISLEALKGRTAQLPGISLDAPRQVIGKNTIDCMQSGIIFGTCSMIDGMIDRIVNEIGTNPTVVATGGLAPVIISYCSHTIHYDANLMLKGLYIIYKMNTNSFE